MQILCSKCRKVVGTQEHHTDPDLGPVLCPDCGDAFIAEYGGVSLSEYLDRFEEPLMVLNEEMRVVACNKKGREEVDTTGIRPLGLLSGDFMHCRNSSSGGGCGLTANCLKCAIRNTVTNTLRTGNPLKKVTAFFSSANDRENPVKEWSLSTRKVGETVHLSLRRPAMAGSVQFRRI